MDVARIKLLRDLNIFPKTIKIFGIKYYSDIVPHYLVFEKGTVSYRREDCGRQVASYWVLFTVDVEDGSLYLDDGVRKTPWSGYSALRHPPIMRIFVEDATTLFKFIDTSYVEAIE